MHSLTFTLVFSLFGAVSAVMANPDFVVVTGPDTVCANSEVQFTAVLKLPLAPQSGSDFSWQIPASWTIVAESSNDSGETVTVFVGELSGIVKASLTRGNGELPISDELPVEVKLPADIKAVSKQACGPGIVEFEVEGPEDNGYTWFGAPGGRQFVNRGGLEKYDDRKYLMYIENPSTIYVQHMTEFGCTKGLIPVATDFVVTSLDPETVSVVSGFLSVVTLSQSKLYKGGEFLWYSSEASSLEPFYTGDNLLLENISRDTLFYVSVSVNGCISARVPVHVVVEEENFSVLSFSSGASAQATAYPNPFNSSTTVNLPDASEYAVQVVDASGRLIMEFAATGSFDLGQELNRGFYLVKLNNGENSTQVRIIKQ